MREKRISIFHLLILHYATSICLQFFSFSSSFLYSSHVGWVHSRILRFFLYKLVFKRWKGKKRVFSLTTTKKTWKRNNSLTQLEFNSTYTTCGWKGRFVFMFQVFSSACRPRLVVVVSWMAFCVVFHPPTLFSYASLYVMDKVTGKKYESLQKVDSWWIFDVFFQVFIM